MRKISQLERVLDSITGASIFVTAQGSHEILYVNDRVKKMKHSIQPGDICEEVWKCDRKHCPACSMEGKESRTITSYDVPFGKFVDISAVEVMWEDRIPAHVISVCSHAIEKVDQGMELRRMQMQVALSQIYTMVISVNLTENTYFMVEYVDFDSHCAPISGKFDDLVAAGAESMHPDYREDFLKKFSRDSLLELYASGGNSRYMTHRQMGDDGKYHWTDTHVIRVENPYGDDVMQISLSRNIDERKKMEEQMKTALEAAKRANRAKTEFISRMSHDIRTPINAIMGMSNIASTNLRNPEKVRDCLDKMGLSTRFLLSKINDILDMSKLESGKLAIAEKKFQFRELIQELKEMIALQTEEKKQKLEISVDDSVAEAYVGDDLRLNQILFNLLSNAVSYTLEGGSISLKAEQISEQGEEVLLRITVTDNGIGMSEEFQKVLFEPFEQECATEGRVFEGSGLGLPITRSLVQLMGGTIRFESKRQKGTTFVVELPFKLLKTKEKEEAPEEEYDFSQVFQGQRVLVVEDNEINLEIVQTFLESWNLQVDAAENGLIAVEKFKNSQPGWYQLVLMDIRMPVMDGLTATREIRALDRADAGTVPIMALTANVSPGDSQHAKKIGMNEYLTKPVEMKLLHRKIKEFI
ncbi:MAG: response regulator [Lachnospiraceae bacterium]|nr:response regulator [Lachnospiraceae bacterium]